MTDVTCKEGDTVHRISSFSIRTFDGDFEDLASMGRASWGRDYRRQSYPDIFDPEFLKFCFNRPSNEKDFKVAAYYEDEIAGFIGGMPKTLWFEGREVNAVVISWLTTADKFKMNKRSGGKIAISLMYEIVRRVKESGKNCAFFYLDAGHSSTKLVLERYSRKREEQFNFVKKIHPIVRVLDVDSFVSHEGSGRLVKTFLKIWGFGANRRPMNVDGTIRSYRKEDLVSCIDLLHRIRNKASLSKQWTKEDLGWQLDYPGVSFTLVFEKGGEVQGVINCVFLKYIHKSVERVAVLENVYWDPLSRRERRAFFREFLQRIEEEGCAAVVEFNLDYYDTKILYANRFFPLIRYLQLWAITTEPIPLQNLKKIHVAPAR